MKVNELMIGDWVKLNKDYYCKFLQLTAIDETYNSINYFDGDVEGELTLQLTDIEPIPLTPEILEKNGFQYTNQHTLKGADTYVLRLEQRGFDLRITIKLNDYFALDSYDDRMYRLAEIQTGKWYVHDLQNALRLCGIDKSIEL